MSRVLVIGAGGVFGSRLCEGLLRSGFEVVVAGRDGARAEAVAARLRTAFPRGRIEIAVLDTATLTAADLKATGAVLVADAAGPFQGAEPATARAAIAAGLHYIDLADGRDFVVAFPALDAAAGVTALTGCSSTPALSNAVLDRLTDGWREVVSVEAAISPGARAPRGLSVMRAILSWLGQPVQVFEAGAWTTRAGWSGPMRATSAVPVAAACRCARRRTLTCFRPGSRRRGAPCSWRGWSHGRRISGCGFWGDWCGRSGSIRSRWGGCWSGCPAGRRWSDRIVGRCGWRLTEWTAKAAPRERSGGWSRSPARGR